jgi:hypothetical protein
MADTRVPGGQFGGRSTTSPSAKSLFAMCLPMPWHPPIAHIRSGQQHTLGALERLYESFHESDK